MTRERLGETYRRQEQDVGSPYPTGALSAMGRSARFATDVVKDRWASLMDEDDPVPADQWEEVAEGRDIPWEPGMTKSRADHLIQEHDYEQYAQHYEGRPIAEFVGMMGPFLFDPVSVATMPVGGANFAAAARAPTLGKFMQESVRGGAKVGAASAPLEVGVQTQAYGELRGDELAGTILGPIAAAPILSAPGRVLRSLGERRGQTGATDHSQPDVRQAAAAANQSDRPIEIDRIIGPYQQEAGVSLAPPVRQIDPSSPVPTARMEELFGDWDGGAKGWFQRYARGDEDAVAAARQKGFDPDSDALRGLVREEVRLSSRRGMQPDEGRFTDLRDLVDAEQGRATPDQMERLRQRGMADRLEQVQQQQRELADLPADQRRIAEAQTRQGREIRALRQEMRDMEVRPEFRDLAEALDTPGFRRTAEQKMKVDRFLKQGAAGVQDARMNQLEGQFRDTNERLINLREDLAQRKGRKPKQLQDEVARLEAERAGIQQQMDALRSGMVGDVDGQVPLEQLLDALDAARMEAPVREAPLRDVQPGEGEAVMARDDPQVAELEAWARSHGQDPMEARGIIERVEQAMAECRL